MDEVRQSEAQEEVAVVVQFKGVHLNQEVVILPSKANGSTVIAAIDKVANGILSSSNDAKTEIFIGEEDFKQ